MKNSQISVVIPCFNEEKTICQNLIRIADYLDSRFRDFEIIAVNDGSTDSTSENLKKAESEIPMLRIIDNTRNEGKGKAVRDGILASFKNIVMFLDADLGIPIEELEKFIPELENGFDIVIASRFVPGLRVARPVLWHRRFMEKVFRLLRIGIINIKNVKDTQCGFKVFRREAAMKIFSKITVKRFAFDAEVIFVANKYEYKIKELPIHLQNPPSRSLRIFRDPVNMIWDLLRIRKNNWERKYE